MSEKLDALTNRGAKRSKSSSRTLLHDERKSTKIADDPLRGTRRTRTLHADRAERLGCAKVNTLKPDQHEGWNHDSDSRELLDICNAGQRRSRGVQTRRKSPSPRQRADENHTSGVYRRDTSKPRPFHSASSENRAPLCALDNSLAGPSTFSTDPQDVSR